MLQQWRFKVTKKFAVCDGEIYAGKTYDRIIRTKPRPFRMFLYKPSSKRYDYVDYTGRVKGGQAQLSEITPLLEFFEFIKFVDSRDCDGRSFT